MQAGLTEDTIQKMHDYEASDLPERQKMALRLADRLSLDHRGIGAAFVARLREQFSEEEIIDLGMSIAFLFAWGRFIEAFGILPDSWQDGSVPPWEPTGGAGSESRYD